jgi:manganese-dependent inorganic pyrophosphatase
VAEGDKVVIVDTNNPAELPPSINKRQDQGIIDHHKLVGGLETNRPDRHHHPPAGLHRDHHA